MLGSLVGGVGDRAPRSAARSPTPPTREPSMTSYQVVQIIEPSGRRHTLADWVRRGGLSRLVFALPLLVVFGVFSWLPIGRAVVMSFQETNLIESSWVGMDNFRAVFADPLLGQAVRNTGWFALLALVFGYPVPLVGAVLMSTVRRMKGLYSVLAYLPVVVPPVVGVLLITLILQIIGTAQVFLEPYLFTSGGPANATVTVLLLIYRYAFGQSLGSDYGMATALSLLLALFLGVLSLVYFRLTRSWSTS